MDQRLPGRRAQLRERAGVPGSRGANCASLRAASVDGLALGQVLVVRAGQYAGAVAAEEALQVAVVDVAKGASLRVRGSGGTRERRDVEVAVLEEHGGGVATARPDATLQQGARSHSSAASTAAKSDACGLRAKRQHSATTMRILAIGDSLTAGYCLLSFKPWAPVLSKLLPDTPVSTTSPVRLIDASRSLSPRPTARAWSDVCGDEWPGARHQLGSVKYDVGIIMGGINDLAYGVSAKDIVANLASLHQMCWDAGAFENGLLSIPPSAGSGIRRTPRLTKRCARGRTRRARARCSSSTRRAWCHLRGVAAVDDGRAAHDRRGLRAVWDAARRDRRLCRTW